MKINSEIKLTLVSKNDAKFLYGLLKERESDVNISHKKMPTYAQHIKFIESKPYSKWYIIEVDGERAGSIYLTKQNEIGIFLNEGLQEKGICSNALNVLIGKNPDLRYLANINPENKKSIKFFKKLGFTLIQYTYELNK